MNNKLNDLTHLLRELPGISMKQAERIAVQFIEDPEHKINLLKIVEKIEQLSMDELTGLIVERGVEPNKNKDKEILLIAETNKDINNILKKLDTNKSMFVLNLANKRDFNSVQKVLDRLFKVIKIYNTKEVIFLLSPSIESELIMRVIKEEMENSNLETKPKLTRLSMGIPFGGSIEFSDERTIREAIEKREKA